MANGFSTLPMTNGDDGPPMANGFLKLPMANGGNGRPMATVFPHPIMVVVMSIEQELRQRIPEVEYLEMVP